VLGSQERLVEAPEDLSHRGGADTDDHAIGFLKILDGGTLWLLAVWLDGCDEMVIVLAATVNAAALLVTAVAPAAETATR
jgi:hypothetical protein